MTSIYDVAKLAGVSPATVSRAFAKPSRVHEETLAKIQAAAAELGYRTRTASPQTETRTRQLALVVSDAANPYFIEIIRGAIAAAAEADHMVIVMDAQESIRLEEKALQSVLHMVDGVILAAPRMPDAPIRAAARARHVILLSRHVPEVPSISPNDRAAMGEAIAHLAALGHKSVSYVAGPEESYANQVRWKAIRDFSAEHGIRTHLLGPVTPNLAGGDVAARKFSANPTSSIICFNDVVALGLMRELRRMGFSIPRDVSVIGVDNVLTCELVDPQLTTVSARFAALGSVAVHTLVSMINGSKSNNRENVILPMRLIVRGSTGPAALQPPISA